MMTFRTPEEAFERANNIPYGLSAGVWTDKGSKIFKMVNKLRAAVICFSPTTLTRSATTLSRSCGRGISVVWANTYNKFDSTSPFGSHKENAFGRMGDCGDWQCIAGWVESH